MWEVEFTDEFERWWNSLDENEQESVAASVELLQSNMKELRTQHRGRPIRTFFAFDPRRTAILLIGGDKTGDARFYAKMIPLADKLYDEHLRELRKEGLI